MNGKLPSEVMANVARRLHVELIGPLRGASCSEVWAGRDAAGREVVLKIAEPHAEERESIGTLLAFSACGGVEILDHDLESGAIKMPRLLPGAVLSDAGLRDDEALDICVNLTLGLRNAKPCPAIDPEKWFASFLRDGPEDAVALCRHLIATTTRRTLLHGDLHHGNILRHGDRWVVIDPKGIWGDPAFEPSAFIRNPIDDMLVDPDPVSTAQRRVERFATLLEEPAERVWGWAYIQTLECGLSDGASFASAWKRVSDALRTIGDPYLRQLSFPI